MTNLEQAYYYIESLQTADFFVFMKKHTQNNEMLSLLEKTFILGQTDVNFHDRLKVLANRCLGEIEKTVKENSINVTAHWWTKCKEDGFSETSDYYMTVFNRTNSDLPWLNVHIFPSNTFQLIPITEKYHRIMTGQYAMYKFKMHDNTDINNLTKWAKIFSNKKQEELSVRIFKENSADEPVLISYELGTELHKRIMQYI